VISGEGLDLFGEGLSLFGEGLSLFGEGLSLFGEGLRLRGEASVSREGVCFCEQFLEIVVCCCFEMFCRSADAVRGKSVAKFGVGV